MIGVLLGVMIPYLFMILLYLIVVIVGISIIVTIVTSIVCPSRILCNLNPCTLNTLVSHLIKVKLGFSAIYMYMYI